MEQDEGVSGRPGGLLGLRPEPEGGLGHSASIPDAATAATFLEAAAKHFEHRGTGGEDRAHWSNVYNAQNCRQIADLVRLYHNALCDVVSWHADAPDVFPDWRTTAKALAEIAEAALKGQSWLRDSDEHPKGEDAQQLSGEAMPARAEGIAK